jgi:allantoinase
MSDFDLVLSGTLVTPERTIPNGFVAVRDGKIALMGRGEAPAARERHVLPQALILPGAVDAQTHSLSQKGQEGFAWSSNAAAAGGVTTMVDMPYDEGQLIASAEAVTRKADSAEQESRVDFALYGTIDPAEGTSRIAETVAAGVASFKFSTFGTDPKRFPRIPPKLMTECFAAIAPFGLSAGVHNENHEAVDGYIAAVKEQGITDWRAHGLSRPPITELLATAEVYEIGAHTGCDAHIVHCSLARGYDMAAAYRAQGFAATIECCIHYLTLDEENDVKRLGGKAKINPPIRPRAEVEALWQRLAAGKISMVSTDHVAWSEDRKTRPDMLTNSSGAPGLEVLVPLLIKGMVERNIPLSMAARLLAENPARHFRISHRKGALREGRDADICVLLPDPKVYDAAATGHTIVGWSPYNGIRLPWTVGGVWNRGEHLFDGSRVLAKPGRGRFIRPAASFGLEAPIHG